MAGTCKEYTFFFILVSCEPLKKNHMPHFISQCGLYNGYFHKPENSVETLLYFLQKIALSSYWIWYIMVHNHDNYTLSGFFFFFFFQIFAKISYSSNLASLGWFLAWKLRLRRDSGLGGLYGGHIVCRIENVRWVCSRRGSVILS